MTTAHARAQALADTRARVWAEASAFLTDLRGREMTVEQRNQWERYNQWIDALAAEANEVMARERNEVEAARIREAQGLAFDREPLPSGTDAFSQFLAGRGPKEMSVPIQRVAKERQLIRQGAGPEELRALAWDTGSAASAVPTTMSRTMFEVLEAEIAMLRAPTQRIITSSGEPMTVPTVVTHGVATQVAGQGTTLAGSDPVFGKLTLQPYKYGQLVKASSETITDAGVDMSTFLVRNIGRSLGRVIDTALISGDGSGEPTGIMTAAASAGSATTGGSLITAGYDDLINVQYLVNDAYRASGAAGWLMRDSTAGTLRKLRDGAGGTEGAPLWSPSTNVIGGQPDGLLGFPVFQDPNVAAQGSDARCIGFVDFNSYILRLVGDPVVERNDSVLFQTDEIAFRGKWRVDGNVADSAAISSLVMNV